MGIVILQKSDRNNENNENFLVGHICFEGPPFFLNNPQIILLG